VNPENKENLKELFGTFLAAQQAEKAVEEIKQGEDILRDNPAIEPDDRLISTIKTEIAAKLRYQKTNTLSRIVLKAAAVAALFAVMAVVSTRLFQKETGGTEKSIQAAILPQKVWENGTDSSEDSELGILTAEVEQISKDLMALTLGADTTNGSEYLTEIEMELIKIDSDFWKG
jgi:hypothetical protein